MKNSFCSQAIDSTIVPRFPAPPPRRTPPSLDSTLGANLHKTRLGWGRDQTDCGSAPVRMSLKSPLSSLLQLAMLAGLTVLRSVPVHGDVQPPRTGTTSCVGNSSYSCLSLKLSKAVYRINSIPGTDNLGFLQGTHPHPVLFHIYRTSSSGRAIFLMFLILISFFFPPKHFIFLNSYLSNRQRQKM